MKIRTLIADDEPIARERIRSILVHYPEFEVVGECSDGYEAIRLVRRLKPDLLFLDIQMPEMDGVSMMKILEADRPPATIFVTAHEHFALDAFEMHAVDYLLKPFDKVRFIRALEKVKSRLNRSPSSSPRPSRSAPEKEHDHPGPQRYVNRFMIKKDGRVNFVRASDIDWIESSGNYLRLHVGDRTYLIRDTMMNVEGKLDPLRFMRIHRGVIVCVERVKELNPAFHGEYEVILGDGTRLTMSRGDKDRLMDVINRSRKG